MIISKLNETHLKECSLIYVDTFNEEPWNDNWDEVSAFNRLNEIYKTPGFIGFVVIDNGKLLGAVLGHLETWFEGYMYNLKEMFIKKSEKGNGVGSKLFRHLEDDLKNHEVTSISLFTSKGDLTERFYLKNGCVTEDDMIMMSKDM